jgi:hypothetical protein
MASIEIAVGHPHNLGQAAFNLKFTGVAPSDELFIRSAESDFPINRGPISAPFGLFMRLSPGSNSVFMIGFEEIPEELHSIDIFVKPYADSYPAWVLEGLENPDEIWTNHASRITAGKSVCLLSFSRTADGSGWHVEAQNRATLSVDAVSQVGAAGVPTPITVNEDGTASIPSFLNDEIALVQDRNLLGSAMEFEVIIDISASMHGYLRDDYKVPALLESLQGLSATINQRPIDVSYGGVLSLTLSVNDMPKDLHVNALPKLFTAEAQGNADSEGYLERRFVEAPNGTAFLVVTDAMPYLDIDELLPTLRAKQQQVRILLLAEPIKRPFIGDDHRISMQVLDMNDDQLLHQLDPFV